MGHETRVSRVRSHLDHGGELPDLGLLLYPDECPEGDQLTDGEHGGQAGVGLRHHRRVRGVTQT